MTTAERLQQYYPFDQEVIDAVSAVAERQAADTDYNDLFQRVGIEEPKIHRGLENYSPIQLVDIRPTEHDEKSAMVIHLAMANPLDPNQLYQIGTIAAANPNTRIIAAGNPSGIGYAAGKMNHAERKAAAHGDFGPLQFQLNDYIKKQGIDQVDQVGYSYGADRAMAASTFEVYEVVNAVAIEPASVVKRSLLGLAGAFASTDKMLKHYVNANEISAFEAARKDSVGKYNYAVVALGRLSNIAVARGLTHNLFAGRAAQALQKHPDMQATIAWGTESELAKHEALSAQVEELQDEFGYQRVDTIILPGQKHALANDLALQSAIVAQALRG